MEHREDREILRKGGFKENEVVQLSRLRAYHTEKERREALEISRRLEFMRWLVATGKLSEQIA
ncbi:MAG: hypothetical protein J2P37_29230 [Ktedonobacteraceae bacterium]|nr:hypothetical protein [Ktedonobacteraceae bacterium]MBO0791348.1 hypothetical protein [Ktedonobacteraceae bacterium]